MMSAAQGSFARRLAQYTSERFPLPAYLPMILLAAFATLGYSRVARAAPGFTSATAFAVAAFTLLVAFFTLRVADEHKDAAVDREGRPELPVPRGLVTLAELRVVAGTMSVIAIAANLLLSPVLLVTLGAVVLWIALMTREFNAREWLRRRHAIYLISHMIIMPLLMLHTAAIDWMAEGEPAPQQLGLYLAAAFATGLVLEIGRKIRSGADERTGVETYSHVWGAKRAAAVWLIVLALSAVLVASASYAAGSRWAPVGAPLISLALSFAAIRFLQSTEKPGAGKAIDVASAVWTLTAYALLSLPWVERAL